VEDRLPRKLAAILYADVAGYSRLTGEDEDATHRRLREYLDLIAVDIESHRGQTVHYAGDAVLAKFDAVVDALTSAVAIQGRLADRNEDLPENRKVRFRIGINLGDVIEDRGDIYGDGVNVAARLESLADEGGICISESVRTAIGNKLGVGYEFMGEQQVKNIADPVKTYRVLLDASGQQSSAADIEVLPLPDRPSIAVLPFDNMSDDPEQEYFADGLVEDVITELSREQDLFVIARNSSFAYKGQSPDIRKISRELGVHYILEGSVRKAGSRIRLNAQLIEGASGHHIWAERFDRAMEDVFEVQDELTSTIYNTLLRKVTYTDTERALARAPQNIDAYEHLLRAWGRVMRFTPTDNLEGRREAEAALAIDPNIARAHMIVAWTYIHSIMMGQAENAGEALEHAHQAARKSVALDRSDFWGHGALGFTELFMRQHDRALAALDRAIALNPNSADAHALRGTVLNMFDRPEEGLVEIELAVRHNPHHPDWYLLGIGRAYYLLGRHDEAILPLNRLAEASPNMATGCLMLAANLVALGRDEQAREHVATLLKTYPGLTLNQARSMTPFSRDDLLERYLDELRQAGVPD
jgi:adenylate cyclase